MIHLNQRIDRLRPAADTAFRILFSLIFVTAGLNHVLQPAAIATRLHAAPLASLLTSFAPAEVLVVATGVALLAGGVALLVGGYTRVAALLLATCLVPITITIQLTPGQLGPLFKNIALLGGLVHFAIAGARSHAWSVDRWLARRPAPGLAVAS